MSDQPTSSSTTASKSSNDSHNTEVSVQPSVDLQQRTIPSASTTTHNACPFLDLPSEMRLDIYELTLLDVQPSVTSLQLLQTCRKISMEARPTLYKRPTSFTSQDKLFAWIDRSRKQDLKRVRRLTLRLTDIDLSPLLDQSTSLGRRTRTSVWTLYQSELERLDDALRALPSLSSLTIVPPNAGRSQLLKGLYHSFLAMIPKRCPRLKHLELQDHEDILEAVPTLRDISGFVCTGGSPRTTSSNKSQAQNPEDRDSVVEVKLEEVEGESVPRKPQKKRPTLRRMSD